MVSGRRQSQPTLVSAYGYTAVHSGRTPDGMDLAGRYSKILGQPGKLVLDRCFISELVYGPLRHGRSRISTAEAASLATAIAERDGVLVHLTGRPEEIVARLRARDGQSPPLTEIKELLDAYANAFAALAGVVPIITADPSRWVRMEG